MPRYFFDTFDGRDVIEDTEGQEVSGPNGLLREATEVARELVLIILARGDRIDRRELRVRDSVGCVVLIMTLRDAMTGQGEQATSRDDHPAPPKLPCSACLALDDWRPVHV